MHEPIGLDVAVNATGIDSIYQISMKLHNMDANPVSSYGSKE